MYRRAVEKAKGQHLVLKSVDELRCEGFDVKVMVVGGVMDEKYLNELKNKYSHDIFVGFKTNVSDYMQSSDCFVLATLEETFGLVLIEAMKAKVPVLALNKIGGPREIIKNNYDGFLCSNENELKEKIKLLIQDENLKTKLIKNAKAKADEMFDLQKQFSKVNDILQTI